MSVPQWRQVEAVLLRVRGAHGVVLVPALGQEYRLALDLLPPRAREGDHFRLSCSGQPGAYSFRSE